MLLLPPLNSPLNDSMQFYCCSITGIEHELKRNELRNQNEPFGTSASNTRAHTPLLSFSLDASVQWVPLNVSALSTPRMFYFYRGFIIRHLGTTDANVFTSHNWNWNGRRPQTTQRRIYYTVYYSDFTNRRAYYYITIASAKKFTFSFEFRLNTILVSVGFFFFCFGTKRKLFKK